MDPEKKSNGALVGLVIIIIILVIGGLYMWKADKDAMEEIQNGTADDSSELNALEADLNATDTSTGVDANTVY